MQHTFKTTIQDGKTSLQRSNITDGTLTVDGDPVDTEVFTVDYLAGTIERVNKSNYTTDLYEISFEWTEPVKSIDQQRLEAYRAAWTLDEFEEAYFEKHYENDSTKMDALQTLREGIKIQYPE